MKITSQSQKKIEQLSNELVRAGMRARTTLQMRIAYGLSFLCAVGYWFSRSEEPWNFVMLAGVFVGLLRASDAKRDLLLIDVYEVLAIRSEPVVERSRHSQ